MARIILEAKSDLSGLLALKELAKAFPEIRYDMMNHVGRRGTNLLFMNFFQGSQALLHYRRSDMKDKKGNRTVSYSIAKRAEAVKIRSYPANFFEKGRKLRNGTFEDGKFIITRKFKPKMESDLALSLDIYDRIYLQKKLNSIMG